MFMELFAQTHSHIKTAHQLYSYQFQPFQNETFKGSVTFMQISDWWPRPSHPALKVRVYDTRK